MAQIVSTSKLSADERKAIHRMWNTEYPKQMHHADLKALETYLEKLHDSIHHLALDQQGTIVGWLAIFTRDSERWLVVIIDGNAQGNGVGSALLDKAKATETTLNGWVVDHDAYTKPDGSPYQSPLGFYRKHGFVKLDKRLEQEDISAVKVQWQRSK